MSHDFFAVLDAAARAEDAIDELIARSPRRLVHVAQMRRSAHAIAPNISEGLGRGQPGDKRRSFELARGEAEEALRHLKTNKRQRRITTASYWPVHNLLVVIIKMLTSLLA